MKTIHCIAAAMLLPLQWAPASIGFSKSDCTVYGNLVEQSPTRHVYQNKYVKYIFDFDKRGIVTQLEVRFVKGKHPSFALMRTVLPDPISKKKRLWRAHQCEDNEDCISVISKDKEIQAHFKTERWNRPASILITKVQ
ncbi:hypothetical protein [Rubritalea tangerina]|uniref:Uncharacterized protein n=1 Tax=Rubritalea tangerina TaxID=430798 RepID=A0ABW4ZDK6_9BACT